MCVTCLSGRKSKEINPEHSNRNIDDIPVTLEKGDKSSCCILEQPFKKWPLIVRSPPSGERSRIFTWLQLNRNPVSTDCIIVAAVVAPDDGDV